MMEPVNVTQAILVAVVTIYIYLWFRNKFANSSSALPLRPKPTRDGPMQPSEQKQDIQLDHANPPGMSKGQTEASFPNGPKVHDYPNTTVATDLGQSNGGQHRLPKGGRTFRVRGVPQDWDEKQLRSFLAGQDGLAGPTISSLAVELRGCSRTATVAFQNAPRQLLTLRPEQPWKIPLPTSTSQSARSQSLALDDSFLGITTLYAPPSQDHKVDIIAISGLGGHAFGSFKERSGEHMWLRDALPHDIKQGDGKPYARVMVYGYESSLPQSHNMQNLEDLATSFRSSLLGLVSAATPKPIIFIAHSLGGLIVKQTLISLSKSTKDDDQKLCRVVYGIVFFGVPHDGMDISSLIPMVEDGPNRFLLESIGKINSQILSIQQREFHKALGSEGESEIVCFYETLKSPTFVQDEREKWTIDIKSKALLVTKSSATHCRPWEDGPEHICAINRTHSEMVKFGPQDVEYEKALGHIKGLAQRALVIRPPNLSQSSQRCLQSLVFTEIDTRSKDIDHAIEGTCQWLLEHETYKNWAACPRGLLWIKGKPGSGKSTLLKYAYKHVVETSKVGDGALVLSFFFHGRGAELQRTPLGLFRSLLHQILRQVPDTLSSLVDTFDRSLKEKGEPGKKWEWHPNELQDFFESSLPGILQTRSIWLFVDALDEAGEKSARDLVQKFKLLLTRLLPTRLSFRICFACREYPVLDKDCEFIIRSHNENQGDIFTYVQDKFSSSGRLKASTIPDLVTKRAEGVFMWARLVMDQVLKLDDEGAGLRTIEKKINSILPELDELYNGLVQSMDDRPTSLKLIQWICFAARPVSLDELRWAMMVDAKCPYKTLQQCQCAADYDSDMERRLKTLSRGLAEIVLSSNVSVVQFIHQSVKDFFVGKGLEILTDPKSVETRSSGIDVIGIAHYQLSRTCIRYLAMEEIHRSTVSDRESLTSEFPLLQYATTSWISHAKESEARNFPQDDLLDYFAWPSDALIQLWAQIYYIMDKFSDNCPPKKTLLIHVVSRYQLLGPLQRILQNKHQDDAEIEAKDDGGRTPLLWAARDGREAVVQQLLEKGADIEAKDDGGWTPLLWAARDGRGAVVQQLLEKGADIEAKDDDGWTPLSWAAGNGRGAVVQQLLEKGADIEAKEDSGRTPLSWAAAPLSWAAGDDHEAVVQQLLERGADIEAKDYSGRTPLSWAARNGHETIVRLLRSHVDGVIPATSTAPRYDSTDLAAE